jgi:hypothetical protein
VDPAKIGILAAFLAIGLLGAASWPDRVLTGVREAGLLGY